MVYYFMALVISLIYLMQGLRLKLNSLPIVSMGSLTILQQNLE